jgi:transposase-like protein
MLEVKVRLKLGGQVYVPGDAVPEKHEAECRAYPRECWAEVAEDGDDPEEVSADDRVARALELLAENVPVRTVAKQLGVSATTIYNWRRQADA